MNELHRLRPGGFEDPDGTGEPGSAAEPLTDETGRSMADELLDDLMPPEFDWRGVVRRHPMPALAVAAAAGYWIGSSRRSAALVDAVMGAITAGVVARIGGAAGAEDGFDEADDAGEAAE